MIDNHSCKINNMTAPKMDQTRSHLLEICRLLERWKWLALTRATHIIVDDVFDRHSALIDPMSSLSVEGHVALLSGDVEVELPPLIREFVESTANIELKSDCIEELQSVPMKKISGKKQHETSRLTKIVSSVCSSRSIKYILDIGSGLGYVDRQLCEAMEDCEVLAIESEEARCTSADAANKIFGLGGRIKQLPIKLQAEICLRLQMLEPRKLLLNIFRLCPHFTQFFNEETHNQESGPLLKDILVAGQFIDEKAEALNSPTNQIVLNIVHNIFRSNVKKVSEDLSRTVKGASCLIALHACGDLTPTALRLFKEMPLIESVVILSCCYHKMSATGGHFHNFPMSNYLKAMFASGAVDSALADVSFLRLAAESTKELWAVRGADQLELHSRSVAYRAIVELYEQQKNIKFTKKVRKAVKPSSRKSWSTYVESWVNNTDAVRLSDGQVLEKDFLIDDLKGLYSEKEVGELVTKTLAFNTLKTCVQHLAELLVLEDRLLALLEEGSPECGLVRVSDPSISPRSIAIVANR